MILQYLNRKTNRDKILAKKFYKDLIEFINILLSEQTKHKEDLGVLIEIISILLVVIFNFLKLQKNKNTDNFSQELLNLFIKDLDYSFRKVGIGDMSIGKYVKSYVKKFYFRINKFEEIIKNLNQNAWSSFFNDYNIVSDKDLRNFFNTELYDISKKIIDKGYLQDFNNFSLSKLIN